MKVSTIRNVLSSEPEKKKTGHFSLQTGKVNSIGVVVTDGLRLILRSGTALTANCTSKGAINGSNSTNRKKIGFAFNRVKFLRRSALNCVVQVFISMIWIPCFETTQSNPLNRRQ